MMTASVIGACPLKSYNFVVDQHAHRPGSDELAKARHAEPVLAGGVNTQRGGAFPHRNTGSLFTPGARYGVSGEPAVPQAMVRMHRSANGVLVDRRDHREFAGGYRVSQNWRMLACAGSAR